MTTILEFDVWENQRLSVKDQVYRHDNRLNGDRPAWSTRDGKHGLHREAFLLPDDSWEWDGPWFLANLEGKPIEDAKIEKFSPARNNNNTNTSVDFSNESSSPASSASSGNSKGWFYAPSYLVSTKHCSSEPNALSLVRRRRWLRRAKRTIAGIVLPHPVTVINYGYSCNTDAVALCSQNPQLFPLPSAAPTTFAGKASAFFKSPFRNKNNGNDASSSAAATPPSGVSNATFARATNNVTVNTKNLSPQAIGEASLLLKHQSTFDIMQSFAADLFLHAKSPESIASTIPPEIFKILKESGIPQTLRAPIWMGFSGALSKKMKNRGQYKRLLEVSQHKQRNANSSINLDVARTCSSHPYFNQNGPGAKALRNILFAYQEYAIEKILAKFSKEQTNVDLMSMMENIEKKTDNVNDENDEEDGFGSPSSAAFARQQQQQEKNKKKDEDEEEYNVYQQFLSYIASVFVFNCQDEEDAFWLLTVMAEDCSLLLAVLQEEQSQSAENLAKLQQKQDGSSSTTTPTSMTFVAEKFSNDLKAKAPPALQEIIANVDFTMSAYSFFQALLTAHTSAPVSSRLFDIFLVNVKDSMVFVDFAVALCLKCFLEDGGVAFDRSTAENGGRADTVSVSKFLNEQMRKVSCDIAL